MKNVLISMSVALVLAACAQVKPVSTVLPVDKSVEQSTQVRPQARPSGLNTKLKAPPTSARTAEQFDTTSAADKAEAVKAATTPVVTSKRLGLTIASLGSPADPGFWLETPLVNTAQAGRVVYPANGKAVAVELRPIDGPKTAGSRLSLPAMRVLEAPLTGLPEVEVFTE